MMLRTHIAVGIAVALYFLPHVNNSWTFFPTVVLASLIPQLRDVVMPNRQPLLKQIGKRTILGEFIRSYTFCIAVAIALAFFYPMFALPFFVGFSFSLVLDTFSTEGIAPFFPFTKKRTQGKITPGGPVDKVLFFVFLIFAAALAVKMWI